MKISKLVSCLSAAASLFCAAPAFAQTPTPLTGPGAAPAAAVPAALAKVSPEMRAAISELLATTRARENLAVAFQNWTQSLPQQIAQAFNGFVQQAPRLTEENRKQLRDRLGKSFDSVITEARAVVQDPKLIDDILEASYPIYASHYSLNEIKQINAFYKTPPGKSIVLGPQILSESLRSGMAIVQPKLNTVLEKALKKEMDAILPAQPK